MGELLHVTSKSKFLKLLNFKPYRSRNSRKAVQFSPEPDEPQSLDIQTPWGETLTTKPGDYLVSEISDPEDTWPVQQSIFEQTYVETKPGLFVKRAEVMLVPLSDLTDNPDTEVAVQTIEGELIVRAGDFYLARGIEGEIWPIPAEKVKTDYELLEPADE
jgi:hypothetical protein